MTFEKGRTNPRFLTGILWALVICAALFLLYVELTVWPADMDEHNLTSGIKNAYKLFGCTVAMLVCSTVERKHIRFEVKASLPVQIIKVVLGVAFVLAIKSGLKPVFNALCGGHPVADALRYGCIVAFAVCVWPLSFSRLNQVFSKKTISKKA